MKIQKKNVEASFAVGSRLCGKHALQSVTHRFSSPTVALRVLIPEKCALRHWFWERLPVHYNTMTTDCRRT